MFCVSVWELRRLESAGFKTKKLRAVTNGHAAKRQERVYAQNTPPQQPHRPHGAEGKAKLHTFRRPRIAAVVDASVSSLS
uniref:Uncharacterized protein n=1 Tax=Knipowitschia caucasica TaxID=637954 RepID=A0AAV2JHQ1_KNICA